MTKVIFDLQEPKKHSGKYIQRGTENAPYPTMMYFRREWFPNQQLPKTLEMTVEPKTD